MEYMPVFLDIRKRRCLVVGAGGIAARKAALLLKAGAAVHVVAPACGEAMQSLLDTGKLEWSSRPFDPADLEDAALVMAATSEAEINRQVSMLARERGIPVNVVDQPALCTFVVPAIVDRSPVIAAVSTGGASPVLARVVRARLETLIPASFGRLATLAAEFRDRVKARFENPPDRRVFWERMLRGRVAELVFAGREQEARSALEKALSEGSERITGTGEVYLVGAGPGDPDLLTFRALRLMQQADVVLYDRLVAPALLELTRRDAEQIYVGKERGHHVVRQEEINAMLVRLARQGRRVLRLKGGDPFIFGRGGEEIDTLAEEGIPFQVVPGVTAAAGCAAYSGIPLTHRDHAQSCTFVTGHLKDGTIDLNWEALAHPDQTVVFYMGLRGLAVICRELVSHGLSPDTPAALVQKGTTREHRVFTATLATLPEVVEEGGAEAPTLIIVGEVVKLHDKLKWFEPTELAREGHVSSPVESPLSE